MRRDFEENNSPKDKENLIQRRENINLWIYL